MMPLARFVGYVVAYAAVDLLFDYLEVRKMRKMTTYTNDNGGEIRAHVVTDDTVGSVMTVGGVAHEAKPGDVLVGTDRSDVYTVANLDGLEGYSEHSDDSDGEPEDVKTDATGEFDPAEYSALEVRQRLQRLRAEGDRDGFDALSSAEREGKNRSSALDGEFDR